MDVTTLDRALVLRAARLLEQQAHDLRSAHTILGAWQSGTEERKVKQEHDRLLRDARDLRALGTRMKAPAANGETHLEDVIAWADGIRGAMGSEHASRVTKTEAELSQVILDHPAIEAGRRV
ncbi:MAG TPA: hypothetical protein VF151_10965 [Gemmatimonadales bacterium]